MLVRHVTYVLICKRYDTLAGRIACRSNDDQSSPEPMDGSMIFNFCIAVLHAVRCCVYKYISKAKNHQPIHPRHDMTQKKEG